MTVLTRDDFPAFFEAATGHEPFLWQLDLVDRLLSGDVPDVIDVPTGFGKTSTLHCWVFALGAGAPLPRRLCFVVDRRVVVDASYEEGNDLVHSLGQATTGITARVAEGLRSLHGDDETPPLAVVRMRGGVTWESRWLTRPDQAAVVVGTVDQFGSRLLLRGYGVSEGMRPVDAALVGLDSWLVIDEAHISKPLVEVATSVGRYQRLTDQIGHVRPLEVTRMSATVGDGDNVLRAEPSLEATSTDYERAAQAARARIQVAKPTVLVDLTDLATATAKRRRTVTGKLGTALADLACRLDDDARVIGVIANTIAAARAAHDRLSEIGEQACLLIGRTRAFERDYVEREWLPRVKVGMRPVDAPDESRLFVVATQTIEVGANLDLDALVTECAPLSALVQRFGRVNRVGERPPRRCAIVHAGFAHGDDDPVYGEATAKTWAFLTEGDGPVLEFRTRSARGDVPWPDASIDLGLLNARALIEDAGEKDAGVEAASVFIPKLVGAHFERWAQTRPVPYPDQPVDLFLHGVGRDLPQVGVAWRTPPPWDPDGTPAWQHWLDLVRPVDWEFVEVPIWELRALLGDEVAALAPTSDLDWSPTSAIETGESEASPELLGVVYRGPSEAPTRVHGPSDVTVGDRVILRTDVGGHDRWGWTGRRRIDDDPLVPDVADLAPTRARPALRLVQEVLTSLAAPGRTDEVGAAFGPLVALAAEMAGSDEREPPDRAVLADTARDVLDTLRTSGLFAAEEELSRRLELFADDGWRAEPVDPAEEGKDPRRLSGLLILPTRREQRAGRLALDAVSDDDVLMSSATPQRQSLDVHGAEVEALASIFAQNLGMEETLQRVVGLAARWHDLGKADPRFQVMLHDGDELAAAVAEAPLAKSGRDVRDPVGRRAAAMSGLPRGFRHEAVSGLLVRELVERQHSALEGLDTDLVHHLVVSHHGFARPLLRPVIDPDSQKVVITIEGHELTIETADQVDWDHPRRFDDLNDRYGWWGLALLETLVRLADMRCSEVQR